MSVSASSDGRLLAIDLQGGIWVLPVAGGRARRVTDEFNDARQPVWSPDGTSIAFQGFRDGGYDIWSVAPDGSHQRQLTWGPCDDREPAWSHDGTRIAFSSDRANSGGYDIWVLDIRNGQLQQITKGTADEYMPSWSPDDRELAFISTQGGGQGLVAVEVAGGTERSLSAPGLRVDAPSWGPDGAIVYQAQSAGSSRLEINGASLTGEENAFPFRAGWLTSTEIVYTSDGLIRRRRIAGGAATTIPFTASLPVTRASYSRTVRDVTSRVARKALGIATPAISPDGRQVAFIALGDLWVMPTAGGKPVNLTNDRFLDAEPAWSPDGRQLVWSTDRGGDLLDLWIRDMDTGAVRRLTTLATSPMGAAWSPDGSRIAFLDVDGVWRAASVSVVDVTSGVVTKVHDTMFGPGVPTWSPDGTRLAIAALSRYSTRFREGTNQILTLSSSRPGDERWFTPVKHLSIDSRIGAGPSWSPDGTRMAMIYEGYLAVVPVSPSGEPLGPPRRVSREMAHQPSWTADGKQILYQFNRHLRLLNVESGDLRDIPVDLSYTPAVPTGRMVVHAGLLVDGVSPTARRNMDIVIDGNRIQSVAPHSAAAHAKGPVVDAGGLTAMPGLIEFHTHLQKDMGEAHARAYLAFGVTTVRSPGGSPYEAVEDREAVDAGVRIGPRLFVTGYLMEWQRVYYKMAVAISSPHHLDMELERGRALSFDLFKSYVRMPDLQQRRIVNFAHAMGVPATSHEVYPSALVGQDGTEHLTGTSRRGYSPKAATMQRSYGDVSAILGAAGMSLTPTLALFGGGIRQILAAEPAFAGDPRFRLYPPWLNAGMNVVGGPPGAPSLSPMDVNGQYTMIMNAQKAGARIVAGTDTPSAFSLHGELFSYVKAGMTPYEALRTATVNAADALRLNAGSIEAGKLADIVLVEGNPLVDIAHAKRVKQVIANGRRFTMEQLVP